MCIMYLFVTLPRGHVIFTSSDTTTAIGSLRQIGGNIKYETCLSGFLEIC